MLRSATARQLEGFGTCCYSTDGEWVSTRGHAYLTVHDVSDAFEDVGAAIVVVCTCSGVK